MNVALLLFVLTGLCSSQTLVVPEHTWITDTVSVRHSRSYTFSTSLLSEVSIELSGSQLIKFAYGYTNPITITPDNNIANSTSYLCPSEVVAGNIKINISCNSDAETPYSFRMTSYDRVIPPELWKVVPRFYNLNYQPAVVVLVPFGIDYIRIFAAMFGPLGSSTRICMSEKACPFPRNCDYFAEFTGSPKMATFDISNDNMSEKILYIGLDSAFSDSYKVAYCFGKSCVVPEQKQTGNAVTLAIVPQTTVLSGSAVLFQLTMSFVMLVLSNLQ